MCEYHSHKNHIHGMKFMDHVDLEGVAFEITKSQSDLDTVIYEWQILQEEKVEAQIIQYLSDIQEQTLKRFDKLTELNRSKFMKNLQMFLKDIKMYPNKSYEQVGIFELDKHTFPVKVKDYFKKADPVTTIIDQISGIDGAPLKDILNENAVEGLNAGGQSVFNIFDVRDNQFVVLDERVISKLEAFNLKLSKQVSAGMNSRIKFQLLEGIKNAEGIPELRKRVLSVFNRPITVKVDPLIRNGQVVRSGYSYQLGARQWATVVSRTEVVRSFAEGRLEAYKQSGVVEKVEFVTAPDERVCPICVGLEGSVYTLEEAVGLIPVHAACRCTLIPVFEGKYNNINSVSKSAKANINNLYLQDVKIGKNIEKTMDNIRNKNYESAVIYKNNKPILAKNGKELSVSFNPSELKQIRGADALVHNHPDGSSFSAADISFIKGNDVKMITVSTKVDSKNINMYLKVNDSKKWSKVNKANIQSEWDLLFRKLQKKYDKIFNTLLDELSPDDAWKKMFHLRTSETVQQLSEKYGLDYIIKYLK